MKKLIYLSLFLIALSSCEKILNKEPTDQVSLEDLFADVSGSKTALAGAYKALSNSNHYQLNTMVYPDLVAGNIKYSKTTNVVLSDVFNAIQNATESSMNETYSGLYGELNNINNIIKYAPSAIGAETDKNKIIAEAKCLRALVHFDLLRVFSKAYNVSPDNNQLGVVINLKPQLFSDAAPVRSTIQQSYQAIITDLTDAINMLDNTDVGVLNGTNRQNFFTKSSAQALLAKVYLYANQWDNAYNLADAVIKAGKYTLLSNANYVGSWALKTPSTESIFEIAVEANFTGNGLGAYYDIANTTYRQYAATNDLTGLYSATDVRRSTSLFNSIAINNNTYFFTKKYAAGGTAQTPVKLLRLSELYLIRAEAAAEKSSPDLTKANADLNIIRQRADISAAPLNITAKADLIDAILLERRKELAFEGNLLYDLNRRKRDITRIDGDSQNKNLSATDFRLIMPLPINTITANSSLIQNPGY